MKDSALACLAMLALAVPLAARSGPSSDLMSLTRVAEKVVVGTVTRVEPIFQTNEFGDRLIVSRTHVRVDSVLKGGSGSGVREGEEVVLEVEGGTIGDLTLTVSDLPKLERGERAVLFLRQNSRGAHVPHRRGQGILKLDSSDRVKGSALSLSAVRAAVEQAR